MGPLQGLTIIEIAGIGPGPFAANQVGFWTDERGTNLLDSGSHFYEVYETSDGKYVSLGSIEPQFYAALLEKLGDEAKYFERQFDSANWPAMNASSPKSRNPAFAIAAWRSASSVSETRGTPDSCTLSLRRDRETVD
jgi:crotonobetainyl-CoA:carnitine CoA-transferase CaiB-like acyl-CoA transferase